MVVYFGCVVSEFVDCWEPQVCRLLKLVEVWFGDLREFHYLRIAFKMVDIARGVFGFSRVSDTGGLGSWRVLRSVFGRYQGFPLYLFELIYVGVWCTRGIPNFPDFLRG